MTTIEKKTSKALNISLWVGQVVLATMFLITGFMKSIAPIEQLSAMLSWPGDVPLELVRFIGITELLGGLGLLLPSLLRKKPILTPIAALCIIALMILAIIFHITRSEFSLLGLNLFLAALALFVTWGRYRKVPITAK